MEFYAIQKGLTYNFIFKLRKKTIFSTDNQFSDWQLRFSATEEKPILSIYLQLVGIEYFGNKDRHTGTLAIMGHTSSPSIVGQFSISCQFKLIGQCIRSQIWGKKETAVVFGDPEVFHGFQCFPFGDLNRARPGIYSVFDHDEGLGHCQDTHTQPRSLDFELRSWRNRKLHSNHLTFPARLGCCVWDKLGSYSGVKPSMLHFWLFLPSREESLAVKDIWLSK